MAKTRLNQDDAFKSIMGKISDDTDDTNNIDNTDNTDNTFERESEAEKPENENKTESITSASEISATSETKEKKIKGTLPTSFYITENHRKALKIKTALGDKPEDKDMSSIVRAALDVYLADILNNL